MDTVKTNIVMIEAVGKDSLMPVLFEINCLIGTLVILTAFAADLLFVRATKVSDDFCSVVLHVNSFVHGASGFVAPCYDLS